MDRTAQEVVASGNDLIPVSVGPTAKMGRTSPSRISMVMKRSPTLPMHSRQGLPLYQSQPLRASPATANSKFSGDEQIIEKTHALGFNRSGDEVTQIAMVYGGENRGQIADIALLFYDGPALGFENNNDVDIVINSIEFFALFSQYVLPNRSLRTGLTRRSGRAIPILSKAFTPIAWSFRIPFPAS